MKCECKGTHNNHMHHALNAAYITSCVQGARQHGKTHLSDQMLAESNMREMKEIVAEMKRRISS